jgi:hypothetical protein
MKFRREVISWTIYILLGILGGLLFDGVRRVYCHYEDERQYRLYRDFMDDPANWIEVEPPDEDPQIT